MFISGGLDPRDKTMNNCYTFNISTNTLKRKDDMNKARFNHGLSKMNQKIFAFGGVYNNSCGDDMKSAEVYDIVKNSWSNIPYMPQKGSYVKCVRVKNQILISSHQFRLMSYDIHNEAYSYVG